MMRWIIGSSLRFRHFVLAASAGVMVLGGLQLRNVKVDTLPEFGQPTVEVQTEALGLSAPEVEQLITVPLEQDLLDGVAWLDAIHSESIPGLSSIALVFEPGTDLLRARQVVQERLSQAHGLPNVSAPPQMLQPQSSTSRVLIVRLSSTDLSPIEMSVLARWTIRPRLLGVPGVANVAIWGQRERQLQVRVHPERLRKRGVSLQQIIETTGNALWASPLTFLEANTPGTGGFIDTSNQRFGIQHVSPIASANDLARIPIEDGETGILRLGDVADVVEDHQPLIGDAVLTGDPGLLLVIQKSPGANSLEVTHGVEAALAALRPGLSGMEIDASVFRPATFVERSTHNLTAALLIGFVLMVLVFGVFSWEWRTVLINMSAVLVSLIVAELVLLLRGVAINAMVAAGLVLGLGIVIDEAVVDVDGIARHLRNQRADGRTQPAPRDIVQASLATRGSLAYATLITLAAVLPFLFLGGESGAFFPPVVLSFMLAILAAMVVALTVTPALSVVLLSTAPLERRGSPVSAWVIRGYGRVLTWITRSRRPAYAAAALVLAAGLAVIPSFGKSLLPTFKDTDLLIHWNALPGTSLPEMDRITRRVALELRSVPGVLDVGAHVGRAVGSDQVVGVDSGELWVSIDPSADYDATTASIRAVVEGYPGIDSSVRSYSNERVASVLAGTEDPIVVRVYGLDLAVLHDKADEVRQVLSQIDGVVHPKIEQQTQEPSIEVEVDLAEARRVGIKPGDVRRAAATLLSGITVGSLFEEQKVFDVVVWSAPSTRNSLSSILDLPVDTPDGGHVRLGDVADVRIAPTPPVIRHEEISRSVQIAAGVSGRDMGSVLADVRIGLRDIAFPLEYHAELVGDYAQQHDAWWRFIAVAIAALIGILLLLQAAFGSWRLASISLVALPVALAGAALGAFVGGRVISLGSIAGLIAVLGIAVRGTVLLFRRFQRLEQQEGVSFGPDLVVRGARDRLVPALMTAVAAGSIFLSFAVSGDIAGMEIVRPMAFVILGGLITSTAVNAFLMPCLYLRFGLLATPDAEEPRLVTIPEVDLVGES